MKTASKLYLKTFLLTAIPYGLIMFGLDYAYGNGIRLQKLLFMSLFFGLAMTLIMAAFRRFGPKKQKSN